MAKKPDSTTDAKKPAPRRKRVKAADAAATEIENSLVTSAAEPSLDEIRDRAYQIFCTGVNQSPVADWFQAERELRAQPRV